MPNPVLHIYCKAHSKVGMYNRKFYTGIEPKVGNECCFARGWLSLLSHLSSSNIRNGRKFPPPINSWFLVVHDPLLPFRAALRSPYLHPIEQFLCMCACVFVIYIHVLVCVWMCVCVHVLVCVLDLYVHVYVGYIHVHVHIKKSPLRADTAACSRQHLKEGQQLILNKCARV